MVYLNHAASSYPKPACVTEAFEKCVQAPPCGQYRGSGRQEAEDLLQASRKSLGTLLGLGAWERIFFTSGATESANLFVQGMAWEGYDVLVSQTEHNSILRPLWNHPALQGKISVLPCDAKGFLSPTDIEAARSRRAVVFISHCSNVTGTIQPMEELAAAVKRKGYLLAVDVSQSAGCIPVDGDRWGADVLFFTGHKALLGLQGTGGIYLRPGLDVRPLKFGGTGRNSEKLLYEAGEYEYEAGTQNLPGIAALGAAARYLLAVGVERIFEKEQREIGWLLRELSGVRGVTLYGPAPGEERGPLAAFNLAGLSASELAYLLEDGYGITTRAGLQCAPLIHAAIGSGRTGVVRASISYATQREELQALVSALREISGNLIR